MIHFSPTTHNTNRSLKRNFLAFKFSEVLIMGMFTKIVAEIAAIASLESANVALPKPDTKEYLLGSSANIPLGGCAEIPTIKETMEMHERARRHNQTSSDTLPKFEGLPTPGMIFCKPDPLAKKLPLNPDKPSTQGTHTEPPSEAERREETVKAQVAKQAAQDPTIIYKKENQYRSRIFKE
jgi:hypothetical protein